MLARVQGRIDHRILDRVTPLAAPLFLEAGRVPVKGLAEERLMAEEAEKMMQAAGLDQIEPNQPKRWAVPF